MNWSILNKSISKRTAILTLLISFVVIICIVWIATLGANITQQEPYPQIKSEGWDNFSEEFEKIGPYNMFVTGNSNYEIQEYNTAETGGWWNGSTGYNPNYSFKAVSQSIVNRFNNKDYTLNEERL